MDRKNQYRKLIRQFSGLIRRDERLANHTSIKIGGRADLFCEVHSTESLLQILVAARDLQIPTILIGGGSNLLVDDRGYRGLIVKFLNQESPQLNFPLLTISAGNSLKDLLQYAARQSLSGLEFLAGIPGSVGGAIYMNAGAYGKSISDVVRQAVIINDAGKLQTVAQDFFRFTYRGSILQACPATVVSVTFGIDHGHSRAIREEYRRILALRANKHPKPSIPCAGSYFKNLPPEKPGENYRPAGYFLENAGAKSMKVGGAAVYGRHANIIINSGNATARDVLELAEQMKQAVYGMYGLSLEEEVRFLDSENGIVSSATRKMRGE